MDEKLKIKIKKMGFDELTMCFNSITFVEWLISLHGVCFILLALFIPNIWIILISAFCVWLLAVISISISDTRKYIQERLKVVTDK